MTIKKNPDKSAARCPPPSEKKTEGSSPLILVADDSPTALKLTSSVLQKQGYRVIQAKDGEEALKETYRNNPSVVVVDLKMPKKDGFEVCAELKKNSTFYIPLLLLTAKEDIESLVKGLELGADDYIIKPFNEMEFIARVRVSLRLKKLNDDLLLANRRLTYLSNHDEQTDLYNHRYLMSMLDILIEEARKNNTNLGLAMFDIDHFKKINDTYGHLEGDRVLKAVAQLLMDSFTEDTVIARYGGEEFIGLFPSRNLDFIIKACQHVIDDCSAMVFQTEGIKYSVTISAGIACSSTLGSYQSRALIRTADKFLYRAKDSGRNRICYYVQS